jgi:hypothetical protein
MCCLTGGIQRLQRRPHAPSQLRKQATTTTPKAFFSWYVNEFSYFKKQKVTVPTIV